MIKQCILEASQHYKELDRYFIENNLKKVLLVCDASFEYLRINQYFNSLEKRLGVQFVKYDKIKPNPVYELVVEGVDVFRTTNCESIIAVGGGSTMDVAKCIKLFSNLDKNINYLRQPIIPNDIKLLAVPTTAGTGSEATRFAVIYFEDKKQSISDDSCIPGTVLFDVSVLNTLPEYQKKSTMLDALCHAIESFWSVNSNDESLGYSKLALKKILKNMDSYLNNEEIGNREMLYAANLAGRAINITQTTAGHAMCYKLTSLYGISHGHAAALCVCELFPYMANNLQKCCDLRGKAYLSDVFDKIASTMECSNVEMAIVKINDILKRLDMYTPIPNEGDIKILSQSVNPVRLKNNPIVLDKNAITDLYRRILKEGKGNNENKIS